ncbi:hypothetical protein VNO77_26976 [Canavalia gladiata]|uniref:Uncharacterized protein n=1 Tax=Canavalia gladiata TaxID=3824 RepID=A0AAN9KTB1_CANGL
MVEASCLNIFLCKPTSRVELHKHFIQITSQDIHADVPGSVLRVVQTQIDVFRLIAEKNSTPKFISGFYEVVDCLPLQKALALDPAVEAYNAEIDATIREQALAQHELCYEIIISALQSLEGDTLQRELGSPIRSFVSQSALDSCLLLIAFCHKSYKAIKPNKEKAILSQKQN